MNWQRREKMLAALAGGLTLLLATWLLFFSGDPRSYGDLEAARDRLAAEVGAKENRMQAASKASLRLVDWQRRALPSDTSHAGSLYQSWLRQLADRLQFHQLHVDSGRVQSRHNTFTLFTFTLQGHASLAKLVEFLFEFYSAGNLHQIRHIDMKPVENAPELDVNIIIEALSLPGADRKRQLTEQRGKTLRLAKLADYNKVIVERNLLGPYSPVSLPDAAQTTFVTAILEVDGRAEVWLVDRTTGKDWKLHQGEGLPMESFHGSVKSIGTSDVTIDFGGRTHRYRCGDNLRAGSDSLRGGGDDLRAGEEKHEQREPGRLTPPQRGHKRMSP